MKRNPVLTVDGILLKGNNVLLVKRIIEPFRNHWVLPGGRLEYGEKAENAVRREMKEELGVNTTIHKLIGVYSDPHRDPREHRITIAYLLRKKSGIIRLNYEASQAEYFPLGQLPSRIGFDHRKILNDLKRCLSNQK